MRRFEQGGGGVTASGGTEDMALRDVVGRHGGDGSY